MRENLIIGTMLFVFAMFVVSGLSQHEQEKQTTAVVSKCDSIHIANDSLVQRIEVMDRRLRQYQIGLWFLRDKNKQAYDYVINAGNLDFKNEW